MAIKENINTYRTTARVVGIVYLAGFVVGIGGNILIQSEGVEFLGVEKYHDENSSKTIKPILKSGESRFRQCMSWDGLNLLTKQMKRSHFPW